jgi:hypothetical protein
MAKATQDERKVITTNINFDRDVWDWLNARVAELKRSKPNCSKKDIIHELLRAEMARTSRSKD